MSALIQDNKILISTYGNMGDTLNIVKASAKSADAQVDVIDSTTIYVEGPTATKVLSDTLNIASRIKGNKLYIF